MKERPILFSTPMVQAILEGRKRMTRRIKNLEDINKDPDDYEYRMFHSQLSVHVFARMWRGHHVETKHIKFPYGQVGDTLWVRETWNNHGRPDISGLKYIYKADKSDSIAEILPWKPSIHMPRSASRINLEITNIRAERLHCISTIDAINEGIESVKYKGDGISYRGYKCYTDPENEFPMVDPVASFGSLWDSINGKKGNGWNTNPWVWVISFKIK